MKITEITRTKRGRYALFADGEFVFSIPADLLAQTNLAAGMELEAEQLEELRLSCEQMDARQLALRLLAARSYTEQELYRKLCEKHDEPACAAAVERMRELNLLDDRDYALRYSRDLIHLGRLSPEGVRRKLREKGIDGAYIEEALAQFDELDVSGRIRELVQRRYPGAWEDEKSHRRAMAALLRLGYSYGEIRDALRDGPNAPDDEFS